MLSRCDFVQQRSHMPDFVVLEQNRLLRQFAFFFLVAVKPGPAGREEHAVSTSNAHTILGPRVTNDEKQ